jgi:putative component of membrane protein insertase Oxa1/YidC/SpoIIIJ protein YidD
VPTRVVSTIAPFHAVFRAFWRICVCQPSATRGGTTEHPSGKPTGENQTHQGIYLAVLVFLVRERVRS